MAKSIVIFDKRVKGRPWATINYYAAVSPRYGGLHIQLVSGTKGPGYTAPRVYTVSSTSRGSRLGRAK